MKKRNSGSFSYNSALFQLKQADNKINYVIKNNSNEDKQLSLYSNWGILKIDLKSDEQTVYDITPHTVSQGGMYMFIRSKTPRLVVASPCRNMKVRPPSLGVYLSNMAEWRCGRSIAGKIDVDGNRADDWSRLIWRVIELVQNAKCKCKGYGNGNVKRDNGCGAFSLISGEIPFVKNYIEVVSLGEYEDKFETDQETGFGVLFIEQLEEDESILKSKHERFS